MIITKEKLRGIIREEILKEAALDSFSIDDLNNIHTFRGRLKYCQSQLGSNIGRGSSRVVFQINDERVLKLALNQKGIEQNRIEGADDYYKAQWDFFPNIYEKAEDWSWMICEYVLPAKKQDFVHCLNVTFDNFVAFVLGCYAEYNGRICGYWKSMAADSDTVASYCEKSEYFNEFRDYLASYNVPFGDMVRLSSYGMALRDGKPMIVILDSGADKWLLDKYYNVKY